MTKTTPKLIIIDGNALIHRSFHALPPTMTTKKGEMVNAVYGFTNVLLKAVREFKPEYIVLTLDEKGPTFRHIEYKEYKAKRIKAPDELYSQIPRIIEIAKAFDIPVFKKQGFEADDLIGTIAKTVDGKVEKIIVTGDLDTLQLVNDHTKVYTMSRGLSDSVIYDKSAVKTRYGLDPDQMIDFKSLRGDPSDNIPGVKGIGEKTACDLLGNFKTLDKIYKNIKSNKIKDRTRDLLLKYRKDAYMSKDLATIKCDVNINFNLEDTRFHTFNKEKVVKILSELEFKSLLPRVYALEDNNKESKEAKEEKIQDKFKRNKKLFKYSLIDNDNQFKIFLAKLKKQKQFTFDTETSSFEPLTANLLGISFSWQKGEAYYINTRSKEREVENRGDNLFNYVKNKKTPKPFDGAGKEHKIHPWLEQLSPIFENKNIKKFGHNIKFDIRVMKNQGIDVKGVAFDTMIASYLLNPGSRQHNLDAVTFTELGFEKISKTDLLGKGRDKITFPEIETEKLMLYSAEDADFTNRLVIKLKRQIKEQKLDKLFNDIEMPLAQVLGNMENNGVLLNKKFLAQMNAKMVKKIKTLETKIHKFAGQNFNINSTQQLKVILFEKLAIPTADVKKTKTGLSTATDELNKLKDLHPIIRLIQEYRELTKLTSTYVDALPELINKKTKRVHTSFNQTVAATGRLSSSEPNLQNIPIRTELGREIRKAFVSKPGFKLLSLDYSQIELRLAAHMSRDKKMIKAFKDGVDIHTATAAAINQVKPGEVTSQMRREAKATNFGILYGQGPHGLSQTADIPYFRAKEFIDGYFKVYKDVKKYIDNSIKLARDKGYAETLFNRRRYLPELNSSVMQVKKAAERMAMNMPLQGTAADMIKVAMIQISQIYHESIDVKMLIQVHDELLFEVKNSEVGKTAKKIKNIMESVINLKVPVVVDVAVGDNWGEMKEL
ncbi:MAG: DNA polymerase I [Patescibacteria group bacterium]